jgi:flagellar biosynthesis protein FlhF
VLERTYIVRDMSEALARIKRDLGPDAIILSSREVRREDDDNHGYELEVTAGGDRAGRDPQKLAATRSPNDARCAAFEKRLIAGGVPMNAARTLSMLVRKTLRTSRVPFVDAVTDALANELTFRPESRARVQALVGPTGVGKTTTVAKLAAGFAFVEKRAVGLVCLDHYRVGASEQLARFADLIGVPMECAEDQKGLERALKKLGKAEVVLIDTAGRSPRDTSDLQFMAETLGGVSETVDITMCLPSSMREAEMCAALSRHTVLNPARLLVTKLDEAVHCGGIVAAHVHSGLPLSHFTTGQRVPEDIEVASPETLAAVLCGEEVQ